MQAQSGIEQATIASLEFGGSPRAMTPAGTVAKHLVDFVLALIGVVCLMPLLATVAVLIKLDSAGPVFFRQKRIGLNGKPFAIFKFRTMVDGAYAMGSRLTVKRDPRITRLGQILRWSKLDELPQLFNVLKGDMNFIGPRPEDPHFVAAYTPAQREVLSVRPGVVGPSQIQGRNEVEDYPEGVKDTERYYLEHILPPKLERDLEYVRAATFWGDLWLLVHGVWITLRGAFRANFLWRRRRRVALMALDVVLMLAAYVLAWEIRLDWTWHVGEIMSKAMALILLVQPPLLLYFGAYHVVLSYFGLWDLMAVSKAVATGAITIAGLGYFAGLQTHPRSVFLLYGVVLLFMLLGSRYFLRAWTRTHPRHRAGAQKAIVVGAGRGGEMLLRSLMDDPRAAYRPVGFIDESEDRWGARIHGVKVLGGPTELGLAMSANGVNVVFVCLSDLLESTAREVAEVCAQAGVDCRMLPALSDLLITDGFTGERAGGNGNGADANGSGAAREILTQANA